MLKAMIERTQPRPIDIARAGGMSRGYVCNVLAGRKKASPRFIEACRSLGLPVDVVFKTQKSERPPVAGIKGARGDQREQDTQPPGVS